QVKARLDVPVIFGGVHPSAVPEVCLENDCVDYVCVGEGEAAIVRLCDALGADADARPSAPIANLWWRDGARTVRGPNAPFMQELDSLPFWDKELWEDDVPIGTAYLTMTSRGCPYRCSFCFNNFFAKLPGSKGGKYVRQRSVEHSIAELVQAKRRYAIEFVDFEDDIFTLDKTWLRAFLDEYKSEIGVPFACLVHPRFMDADMARWLRDAGCSRIQMGVQSVDEEYKRKMLLRVEKDSALRRSLDAMASVGLSMKLDHILGLPGEPITAQAEAWDLYRLYRPSRVNTYWLSYLPGTDITREALDAGRISATDVEQINRGTTRLFHYVDSWMRDDTLEVYQKYDLLFRVLPMLPRRLAARLDADSVPSLPASVGNLIGFAADVFGAALARDRETLVYARLSAYHLRRLRPKMFRNARTAVEATAASVAASTASALELIR
ncbi:MAG TPA: radical SAM protein, partial [Rhizomicrobium sp.]